VDSTEEDPEILRQSVGKRVFFAGEATNYKYQGGLQAAYLTGMVSLSPALRCELRRLTISFGSSLCRSPSCRRHHRIDLSRLVLMNCNTWLFERLGARSSNSKSGQRNWCVMSYAKHVQEGRQCIINSIGSHESESEEQNWSFVAVA
jgi:hypothetical protein